MTKILLRLFALVTVLVMIVLLIGSMLPREFNIYAETEIAAEPEVVYSMINTLPNWQRWTSFNSEIVKDLKLEFGNTLSGSGAVLKWEDSRGSGKMWITESEPNKSVEYELNFDDFPTMKSRIELSPVNGNTVVKWTSRGSLPSGPFYGFSALLFPGQMTYEYDQSLERLKQESEQLGNQ